MNDDQKVVLEWLKVKFKARRRNGWSTFDVINDLRLEYDNLPFDELETTKIAHLKAYGELDYAKQFSVLAKFGEWGMKEVAE